MTEKEFEREIQARVKFKMNEFLTALKNSIKIYYNAALKTKSQKYYFYYEALNILEDMVLKEIEMPVPNDEMDMSERKKKRDLYVRKLSDRLLKRGEHGFEEKERFIAGIVEELLEM